MRTTPLGRSGVDAHVDDRNTPMLTQRCSGVEIGKVDSPYHPPCAAATLRQFGYWFNRGRGCRCAANRKCLT